MIGARQGLRLLRVNVVLVRHGLDERLKGRTPRLRLQPAIADLADEPRHHGINVGQMFDGSGSHVEIPIKPAT